MVAGDPVTPLRSSPVWKVRLVLNGRSVEERLVVRPLPGSRFRVDGAAATLVVPDDDGQTARLTAGRTPEAEEAAWGTFPESRWDSIHRGGVAAPVPSQPGDWSAFYTGSARAVRGDGPPPVDPWDAVTSLEVLEAARTSAATEQVVEPAVTGRPG